MIASENEKPFRLEVRSDLAEIRPGPGQTGSGPPDAGLNPRVVAVTSKARKSGASLIHGGLRGFNRLNYRHLERVPAELGLALILDASGLIGLPSDAATAALSTARFVHSFSLPTNFVELNTIGATF